MAELSEAEQDRIAWLMPEEIEDAARWAATFAGWQDKLGRLAQRAGQGTAPGGVRASAARGATLTFL